MIELIPYSYLDKWSQWSLPDEDLLRFYHQLQNEKTLKKVFYQGKEPTSTDWLEYLKSPANLPVFATLDTYLVGLGWLNNLNHNYAIGHFCMLREAWGDKSLEIGRQFLAYWFSLSEDDKTPIYDVILGITPKDNRKAVSFIHRLGFVLNGIFPHICAPLGDGVISYMENPLYGRQEQQQGTEIEPDTGESRTAVI